MHSSLHDCPALPQGWKRETRNYLNTSKSIRGKYTTTAYTFKGERYVTKYQLAEAFSKITKNENGVDLSSFDWKNGRWIRQHHKQKKGLEQLSTDLFGKGITDINFTISQPTELLKRSTPASDNKLNIIEITSNTRSEIRHDTPRQNVPEYDFDYTRDQGINGTPIEQPMKKRQKQINNMSPYGPLQVFSIKRLENKKNENGKNFKPINQYNIIPDIEMDKEKNLNRKRKIDQSANFVNALPIRQPILPPGMDKEVIESKTIEKIRRVVETPEGKVEIDNPDAILYDFSNLLSKNVLWKQAMFCLTYDGKALPSSAIWGQKSIDLLRISKNPEVFINALQPFVKNFSISKDVIADQAKRVRQLRNELANLQNDLLFLTREKMNMLNIDVSDKSVFGLNGDCDEVCNEVIVIDE